MNERIFPITVCELMELVGSIPPNKQYTDDPIMIVANEDRICIKGLDNNLTLAWIKRDKKLSLTG